MIVCIAKPTGFGPYFTPGCDQENAKERSIYIIDNFPEVVYDNYCISSCQINHQEAYRGYQASKKRYFYGLKIHLLITETSQPMEFFSTPGNMNDAPTLKAYLLDLPEGAQLTSDKAYNDYEVDDVLDDLGIHLRPQRKQNSKLPLPPWVTYLMSSYRKIVETTRSMVERIFPNHIYAVISAGFRLKVALFILACSVSYLV